MTPLSTFLYLSHRFKPHLVISENSDEISSRKQPLEFSLPSFSQVISVAHLGIDVPQTVSLAAQSPKFEAGILLFHWPHSTVPSRGPWGVPI